MAWPGRTPKTDGAQMIEPDGCRWMEVGGIPSPRFAPSVSILMTSYNHGPYLADAIEGVLQQNLETPFELLIGDDCSTDDTLQVAMQYQRTHPGVIRVFTTRINQGNHANFFNLLLNSRSALIARCEGDDYWQATNKLTLQVARFAADPSLTLVHSDYDRRVGNSVREAVLASSGVCVPAVRDAIDDLLCEYNLMTATTMYRKDILEDFYRLDPRYRSFVFMDRPMAMYASLRGKVGFVDRSLATWRYVEGSATNAGLRAHLRMMRDIASCHDLMAELADRPPDNFLEWRTQQERGVYGAAYLCGNVAEMDISAEWLREHDAPLRNHAMHKAMARLKFPLLWARVKHKRRRQRDLLAKGVDQSRTQ